MRNEVFEALKEVMKGRKVNYKTLAIELDMSESGLKKLMASADCSMSKLDQICDALNIDLSDLIAIAKEKKDDMLVLNEKQEALFLKKPRTYHFFVELCENEGDWKKVMKKHRLERKECLSALVALDKVDLIEFGPDEKVKLLYKGNDFTISAKLGELVTFEIDHAFFDYAQNEFKLAKRTCQGSRGSIHLKKESVKEYLKALAEVQNEFSKRSKREELIYGKDELLDLTFMTYIATDFRAADYMFNQK